MPENKGIRLNKYLAMSGVCSRRDADKLIEQGVVTINGKPVTMGQLVMEHDKVVVHKKEISKSSEKHVLAFYKPEGVMCSEKDKYAKKTIMDCFSYPVRVTYAGRLDKDSKGLILLTNDGDLINGLMRGSKHQEKEYIVKVKKEITEEFLHKLEKGIYLKELEQTTRPCKVNKIGKFTFSIILTQGLNRQIRRMCQACGYEVISLERIRIGNIKVDGLKEGKIRRIEGKELADLYELVYGM